MKIRFHYLLLSLLTFSIFYSCSGDDDSGDKTLSSSKQITGFVFSAANNAVLDENVTATINEDTKTVTAVVPYGTDVSSLLPTIEVSSEATLTPEGAQDFSSEVTYTVTAEDDSEATYTVTVSITANTENKILSFQFLADENEEITENVIAVIDEDNKTITAEVPYGTDITSLMPSIEVSEEATVLPEGAQDFSSEVTYTVTAEDGSQVDYTVLVSVEPNTEAKILSFVFLAENNAALEQDVTATIDEDTKTITAEVPEDTDVTGLIPTVEVSPGASFTPENAVDFTSEVTYTVTAEDSSTADYTVIVDTDWGGAWKTLK